ncbi:MAG: Rossman fold protein, TIGR00730 family [Caedibacter sp. 38-128]|nr:TIGR00730 family Rossman fold protein [Holosporales bacterium]OJX05516.1 MAG: Rossman fold protein, TIGR00730 family [Caedibacter sp. 38-128]
MRYSKTHCEEKEHYVGVFCSADDKISDRYKEEAWVLGKAISNEGYHLVTGGSCTGLMNAVINGFVFQKNQGKMKGIIPSVFKEYNVHHPQIVKKNLVWTDNLYQRLEIFQNTCDTLIVLPGGFGTLHELMDFLVARQFGITNKKIILLNLDCFWDYLLQQFKVMVVKNVLPQKHLDLLTIVTKVSECIKEIQMREQQNYGLNYRFWEK